MGAISLRCILSDPEKDSALTSRSSTPQQVSTHRCCLDQRCQCSSHRVSIFAAKRKDKLAKKIRASAIQNCKPLHILHHSEMNGNTCKSISPWACFVREPQGEKQEFLNSFITQYNYVFQPKLMLALLSRIPSFHEGKMRSRTNRLSMLAFPCVSKRDISVWKWALKPVWLI